MAKISKGNNSVKNVGGVTVLVLCTLSEDYFFSTKFHENILDGIEVIELTRFPSGKIQRARIP